MRAAALSQTAITLCIGVLGVVVARMLHFPIPDLTGPAIAVSAAGLLKVPVSLHLTVRNIAFVGLGMSIGAGMTAEATQMLLDLPLAFVALALSTVLGMLLCWAVMEHGFGFERRAGLLAASPGHLSFVLSMGVQYELDVTRITIVQSIRLLALTLLTPLAAMAAGITPPASLGGAGPSMTLWAIGITALLSYVAHLGLAQIKAPAPLLIGAMLVSMVGHSTNLTPGHMPNWLAVPAFVVLGTLIGTRFGGVSMSDLRAAAWAGVAATAITTSTALAFAIGAAMIMGLPLQNLLIAFAPGGLETMVAMSVALGIAPGFVAACHLARLLVLSVALPLMFARIR